MRRAKSILTIIAIAWTCHISTAQLLENFGQYTWQQQDSIITTLYQGGIYQVCNLMIEDIIK